MKKVLLFPVYLVLQVINLILELGIRLGSWIGGIALLFLGVCLVLAVINQMWLQTGLLAGITVVGLLLLFFTATIKAGIEILIEKID